MVTFCLKVEDNKYMIVKPRIIIIKIITLINTLMCEQNGQHFAHDIPKYILLNESHHYKI